VLWAKGQALDISAAAREGENLIELRIANGWRNRLIGDQNSKASFEGQPKTYLSYPIFEPQAEPASTGLLAQASIRA
jgi:hypothetical protein